MASPDTVVAVTVEPDGEIDIDILEKVAGGVSAPTLQKKPSINNDWAAQQASTHLGSTDTSGAADPVQPGDKTGSVSTTLVHGNSDGVGVDGTAAAGGHAGAQVSGLHAGVQAGVQAGGSAGVGENVNFGHGLTLDTTVAAGGHVAATAGPTGATLQGAGSAGFNETLHLTPAVTLGESGTIAGTVSAHIGLTGVSGQVTGGANIHIGMDTDGHVTVAGTTLSGHTGMGEDLNATGVAQAKLGLTGIGAGAEGQASMVISAGESGGIHGHGLSATQSGSVTMGAYAQGDAEAEIGKYTGADGKSHIGVQAGANAMVGDAVTLTEGTTVSAHGVSYSNAVSVTDPGELGAKIGGGVGVSGGELTLNVHGALGFALAGVGDNITLGVNVKPLENAGESAIHALTPIVEHGAEQALHTVTPVVEHGLQTAAHDIGTTAQHVQTTVTHGLESTASTVGHGVESVASKVGSSISNAAHDVEHALSSY